MFSNVSDWKEILENKIDETIGKFPDDSDVIQWKNKFNEMFQAGSPHSDPDFFQADYTDIDLNAKNDPSTEPLSQWWLETPTKIALEQSILLVSSGGQSNTDPSIPSCSLNLTHAFAGLCIDNVLHLPVESPIPLSVVPTPVDPPSPDQKKKRQITKSLAQRSPFDERTINIRKALSTNERHISEWIFSLQDNPSDLVYKTYGGFMAQRFHMESFFPGCELFGHLIDIWTFLLNAYEEIRSPESPQRVFCKTTLMASYLQSTTKQERDKEELFHSHLLDSIQDTDHLLGSVRLVFLPVIHAHHIFTFVIDVKEPSVVILDNIMDDQEISVRYGLLPALVIKFVASYMRTVNHPNTEKMSQVIPYRLEMDWRTVNNYTDCGIFTMRHMETYMGPKKFRTGFKKESKEQQNQLEKLRVKYLTKILSNEHNVYKEFVKAAAAEFQTIAPRKRGAIRAAAAKNIHVRLERFG